MFFPVSPVLCLQCVCHWSCISVSPNIHGNLISIIIEININLDYSGAPAGAEGARGRSTIAIEIGNPSSRENLDVTSVHQYVRIYVRPYAQIRAGDEFWSLSLSLIWSPSLANSNTKTFFGLSRVNLFVVEIC